MRVVRAQATGQKSKQYQRDRVLALLQGGAGLILLALPLVGLLPGDGPGNWIVGLIGLGLLASGAWFGFAVGAYLKSQHSQERLSELLEQLLDNQFIYFRNLALPGQRSVGEIDGVLLGPPGATVILIENYQGEYAVEGDTWYRYGRGKAVKPTVKPMSQVRPDPALSEPRRRLDDSPTWAAIRAAREVKAWLSVRGLPQVIVSPVVVLGSGKITSLKRPSAPVVELKDVQAYIQQNLLKPEPAIENEALAKVVVEQIAHRLQTNQE